MRAASWQGGEDFVNERAFISRDIEPTISRLLGKFPVLSLSGPRQSGKSTLLRRMLPDWQYLSLEDANIRARAVSDPVSFLRTYSNNVILDEVQRAPELLSYTLGSPGKPGDSPARALRGKHFQTPYQNSQDILCDTGLVCNLLGIGDTKSLVTHPQWGGIFENAVVEEVEKRLLSSGVIPKLSFWRDSNGLEADLVVERGCEIMQLMEVKPSATFNSKFFSALSRIASIMDVPTERCSVVYAGDESAKMNMGNLVAPSDIYKLAGPWLQDTRLRWTRS